MADFNLRVEGIEDLDAITTKIERLVALLREADALVAGLASRPNINLAITYDGPTFDGSARQAAREIAAVINHAATRSATDSYTT